MMGVVVDDDVLQAVISRGESLAAVDDCAGGMLGARLVLVRFKLLAALRSQDSLITLYNDLFADGQPRLF